MGLFSNFDISGSAISAQSIRLNTTASNLANTETLASSAKEAYRSRHPVFQAMIDDRSRPEKVGVRMLGIVQSQSEAKPLYDPGHKC
jgi:flagellar basal-body rod protein FlgC